MWINRKIWKKTHNVYARTQLYVHDADPELGQLHIWFVMCRLSTVTLIVILYIICYYMCWFFKVTMILSLIKVASYIQALYMQVLFRRVQWICPLFVYFFMVKREHNAVPKFFKMFSIFQMMFKEVILIQWEFSMIRSRVERRDQVAQFIRQKQI